MTQTTEATISDIPTMPMATDEAMGDGRGGNRAEGSGSAERQQAKVRLRSQGV